MGALVGLDVFEKRLFCCSCQVLNPIYFSLYPSHCTDCAATYRVDNNTKFLINKMRLEAGIGCLIHCRDSWNASLKTIISLDVL